MTEITDLYIDDCLYMITPSPYFVTGGQVLGPLNSYGIISQLYAQMMGWA